jgi:hypothetical protein
VSQNKPLCFKTHPVCGIFTSHRKQINTSLFCLTQSCYFVQADLKLQSSCLRHPSSWNYRDAPVSLAIQFLIGIFSWV